MHKAVRAVASLAQEKNRKEETKAVKVQGVLLVKIQLRFIFISLVLASESDLLV